tara:strand:+ start:454 stop:1533 length:1080 start_codon:yes stop_codon:yes gene_type:complete
MKNNFKIYLSKFLYIFFLFLSLNIFFFSTDKIKAKSFEINDIDISRPFKINFDKNEVIDEGFIKAYDLLISLIVNSTDKKKVNNINLSEIKGMIESFTIKEEKFIDEIYYVNLGVTFNKKKIFNYLESKNIFPSIPEKNEFLFIPIIIDEDQKDLLIFYNNKIFESWNKYENKSHLIKYILPTEDLEDLSLLKSKFDTIEEYDFKEITNRYDLDDSIVALIFRNQKKLRILSRINLDGEVILQNQTFSKMNLNDDETIKSIIKNLKLTYEDFWKTRNRINTSIRLTLNIKVDNIKNSKIINLEKNLDEIDLIYDFFIFKFDKDFTYYQIIFNGTPDIFLKRMSDKNYRFNTQNKIWTLK